MVKDLGRRGVPQRGPKGILVVEDVKCKATRTAVYRLKKKIVEANYGITITEV